MSSRSRHHNSSDDFNIWPAFTDLMSNAFMIALLLLLLSFVQVGKLKQQLEVLQPSGKSTRTPTTAPPIILIQNTGAYQFASGSAELPEALNSYVRAKLVDEIELNAKLYQIDVVEVIGHTDAQPNGNIASNLDQDLEKVARGEILINELHAGSNADLGLMRALELVRVLRSIQQQGTRMKALEFRAYSAAQLISPTGNPISANQESDPKRRRIEIRFTRLGKVKNIQ